MLARMQNWSSADIAAHCGDAPVPIEAEHTCASWLVGSVWARGRCAPSSLKLKRALPQKSLHRMFIPQAQKSTLAPLEAKVGMLLFGWSGGRQKLENLLGLERQRELEMEAYRASGDHCVFVLTSRWGHTDETSIAEDMLGQIESVLARERIRSTK